MVGVVRDWVAVAMVLPATMAMGAMAVESQAEVAVVTV